MLTGGVYFKKPVVHSFLFKYLDRMHREEKQRKAKTFHALLYNKEAKHNSSAVLITNKYALAAAGYVEPYEEEPERLIIAIGVGFPSAQIKTCIINIKIHPLYNPEHSFADIAILTVSSFTQNLMI